MQRVTDPAAGPLLVVCGALDLSILQRAAVDDGEHANSHDHPGVDVHVVSDAGRIWSM